MNHTIVAVLASSLTLLSFQTSQAQQPGKVWRIGYLTGGSRTGAEAREEAFRQGLHELGYVPGKNLTVEYRYAEANADRLRAFAEELVSLKVDLVVAITTSGAHAAKDATKTIPIVMRIPTDPVEDGLIDSLARPGGNVTGVTSIIFELHGKRLELLKEAVPTLSRVGVLWNPGGLRTAKWLKEMEAEAGALGVQVILLPMRRPGDLEIAFKSAVKDKVGAIMTLRNPFIGTYKKQIIDLAIKNRLPTMFDDIEFLEAGGLMYYGANLIDLQRRLATFVDKILKGAKPADLPVEQPTKFEFVINLKTSKQIGVTISPNVLARADRVIR